LDCRLSHYLPVWLNASNEHELLGYFPHFGPSQIGLNRDGPVRELQSLCDIFSAPGQVRDQPIRDDHLGLAWDRRVQRYQDWNRVICRSGNRQLINLSLNPHRRQSVYGPKLPLADVRYGVRVPVKATREFSQVLLVYPTNSNVLDGLELDYLEPQVS
jgi:hypothetical protein